MEKNSGLSSQYRDIFLTYGTERHLDKNQYLLERGSPATELWYITKGIIRAFCAGYDGEDITLFYISENNVIYNEALLPNSVIIQDGQAITPLDFYTLSAEKFLQAVPSKELVFETLFSHVIDRIILHHEYILCSHFHESNKRIAYFLYACYKRSGTVVPYTHEQIAAITGVNRISVNRILNDFSKAKILSLGYRHIKILSASRLADAFNSLGFFSDKPD